MRDVHSTMLGMLALMLGPASLAADPVADFYRGRTLDMIVPTSPGGDYDLRARLMARYMPRYIPGQPRIIARNMPAGVGIGAANYMAKVAPRDGTVLHAAIQNLPLLQAIGQPGIEADVRTFHWIGNTTDSPNVINSWHTTGIVTLEDVKKRELLVGIPGVRSSTFAYAAAMNKMVGTRFRVISGFPGGVEVNLAMEKGEVGGRGNVWVSWKRGHPHWLAEKKIHIIVQIGLKRAADLPDVPLMLDLARNDDERAIMRLLSADTAISRAILTTADTPPERVAALRKAFDEAIKDPELLAEAGRMGMDISPSPGVECQAVSDAIINAPAHIRVEAKALMDATASR